MDKTILLVEDSKPMVSIPVALLISDPDFSGPQPPSQRQLH